MPPSRSRHADRELVACLIAALQAVELGSGPHQCWLQRNLIMQRLALLSWAAAAVALRPVPKPPSVQTKAAKRVGAQLAAAVLAGASTLPLSSLALSADDYDAIYGMSATGSKGSSIKFEMPSFGGDDASDTSAADKKKAADAAAAKEADAAAKAAEREAAREARAKQQQELRDAAKKREDEAQAKKDAALAKAKAATAAAAKKEDAAPAFKPPDSFSSAPSLPTFDAPKVEMPSMPSFSASPPRVNRRGAVDATRRRLGALDSLIALRAGSQARRPLHAVVLDAEIRRESLRMNQIVAACLTHRSMCAQAPEAPSFKMPDAPKLPDAPKMDMPSFSASHQCIKHIVVSYRAQRTHWLIC